MTLEEKIAAIKAKRPELKVGMRVKIRGKGYGPYTVVPYGEDDAFVQADGEWIHGFYEQPDAGSEWDVIEVKDIPPPYRFFNNYDELGGVIWTRQEEEEAIAKAVAEHQDNNAIAQAEALVKEAQKQLEEAVSMLKKTKGE